MVGSQLSLSTSHLTGGAFCGRPSLIVLPYSELVGWKPWISPPCWMGVENYWEFLALFSIKGPAIYLTLGGSPIGW